MRRKWMILVLLLALLLSGCQRCNMAVDFQSSGQRLTFSPSFTLEQMTVMAWVYPESYGHDTEPVSGGDVGYITRTEPIGLMTWEPNASDFKYFEFMHVYSTQTGFWRTNAAPTFNEWQRIVVTYDNTNSSNDPAFYINGSLVASSETQNPIGTATTTVSTILIGSDLTPYTFDGPVADVRYYNRILSATEIADDYNAKSLRNTIPGLVFHVHPLGADGVQNFGGAALGATNFVWDEVTGVKGTPVNSPVGVSDIIFN